MAQRATCPQIVDGDKRVLIIGGEVVPFRWRASRWRATRGNLAAGGRSVAMMLLTDARADRRTSAPSCGRAACWIVGPT